MSSSSTPELTAPLIFVAFRYRCAGGPPTTHPITKRAIVDEKYLPRHKGDDQDHRNNPPAFAPKKVVRDDYEKSSRCMTFSQAAISVSRPELVSQAAISVSRPELVSRSVISVSKAIPHAFTINPWRAVANA
jgi:hypothetical protein